jgi:tRNA pseudouridine55 synthase
MGDCANCPKGHNRHREAWVAPKRDQPLSGILNIDKPPGITSHDVVDVVRRVAGQKKVGHAGTLDPLATGVLVVCLGQATRVAEYLMAGRKKYRATLVLGTGTDTYDADGEVVDSGGRTDFSQPEIEAALAGFVGAIEQVPPMYSAIKRDGQPLYKLAREGKTVEREARPVEIDEIVLDDWTEPSLILTVSCSPGTYIRSLAHDMGQRLGTSAHLATLVRLQSGRHNLESSVSLDRLEEAFQHGQETEFLLPMDEALFDYPAIVVGRDAGRRIVHGQGVPAEAAAAESSAGLCRAYDLEGEFLALMSYHADRQLWRPKKVFAAS